MMPRLAAVAFLLVAGLTGCGSSSGDGSSAQGPDPTASDPTDSTRASPASVTITDLTGPRAMQPGESDNVTWQTTSNAPVTATALAWGSSPGSHPNAVTALSTGSLATSGMQPWAATLTAPASEGTVYYVITATTSLGVTTSTPERSFPVAWSAPSGAATGQ
jgi:hypothetical protein